MSSLLKRIERDQDSTPGGQGVFESPDSEQGESISRLRQRREPVHNVIGQHGGVDIKSLVQSRLLEDLGPGDAFDMSKTEELRARIDDLFTTILAEENIVLARNERR